MGVKKINLAVLISGSGSNLQALINACNNPDFPAKINVVISNRPEAYGLQRAANAGIPAEIIDHKKFKNRQEFEKELQNTLEKYPVDLICLAGFMRILTPAFIARWQGKIINTHPALLPRHGGKGMYGEHVHRAVLAAGDAESGVSIHYVIPEVDQGALILQRRVKIEPGDTPETLAARVLEQEHIAYPEAVRLIAEDRVEIS